MARVQPFAFLQLERARLLRNGPPKLCLGPRQGGLSYPADLARRSSLDGHHDGYANRRSRSLILPKKPLTIRPHAAELASRFKEDGMLAYVELVQRKEKALGCDVLTHQKWSGASYVDRVLNGELSEPPIFGSRIS